MFHVISLSTAQDHFIFRMTEGTDKESESVSLLVRTQALTNGGTITLVLINIICGTPLELFLSSLLFFTITKCRWEIVT